MSFDEVLLGYDREGAQLEAQRGLAQSYAAATAACPFGVDVDQLVRHVAAGDFDAAADVVGAAHPWGSILGRCCHRFCEQAVKGSYAEGFDPVGLRALERAAADFGARKPLLVQAPPTGKRVAVVGAGSGGIGTALGLIRRGHAVTLVDALPEVGGMFMVGYPAFRMPREVLRRELAMHSPLLTLELNASVDRARVEALLGEFDALCLAIGRFKPANIQLPGDDLENVYEALDFLEAVSRGTPPLLGETVAVLGAGYTAQDVARTARRLGATVHVLYRRGPDEMPVRAANRAKFIAMMEREGVPYRFFLAPVRIVGEQGRAVAVECQRTRLGEPDSSGRRRAVPSDEPPTLLPVTAVIKAFGQQPDFSILPEGVEVDGPFVVHVNRRTTRHGLFVVGDIGADVGNDGAFVGGLQTADEIHQYLVAPDRPWPSIPRGTRMQARRPGTAAEGE